MMIPSRQGKPVRFLGEPLVDDAIVDGGNPVRSRSTASGPGLESGCGFTVPLLLPSAS